MTPSTPDPKETDVSPAEVIDEIDVIEDWEDLEQRLEKAATGLARLADRREDPWDHERLLGKVDGIKLALSFMREYRRPVPPAGVTWNQA